MTNHPFDALYDAFAELDDPRVERTREHLLLDIVAIAMSAVICGADSWVAIEEFGKTKHAWLRTFLALPNGIPSHDTFTQIPLANPCSVPFLELRLFSIERLRV